MYEEKKFNLTGLRGLSDKQISEHLKLYSGYVKNVNGLAEKLDPMQKMENADAYTIAELRRRLGFEFNGMRLHEYYFENLGGNNQSPESDLAKMVESQYGTPDNWSKEFKTAGMARGIGWVILYYDPEIKKLHNVWITDHEVGHLAGLPIILAMDVWEHAYLLDYLPSQKREYIEAFFSNINWKVAEERFAKVRR
ncbi:MAG: superoxide dismutase [Candidatus Vogelbacteria bacterium]|nr:superoxide dismutase [Candidatus Vogelbacteria bacterium]